MKYTYLATAVFTATVCIMLATAMHLHAETVHVFGPACSAFGIIALALYGMYTLEQIKEDHKKVLSCK